LKDDETVNRAEHQRLAVEIALLKPAAFPRLREVEQVLSGSGGQAPSPVRAPAPAKKLPGQAGAPVLHEAADVQSFVDRLSKARPLLAGYIAGAKSMRLDGDRIILIFEDPHYAQPLVDATETLAQVAAEVYGRPMKIEIETAEEKGGPEKRDEKAFALHDDPVLKSFQKHLGGEVVREKR
jgi:hypothetical protein